MNQEITSVCVTDGIIKHVEKSGLETAGSRQFWTEICRIFSNDFRSVTAGKHRSWQESTGKKSEQYPARVTASMFQCFPAGYCRIRWLESLTWVIMIFMKMNV